MLWWMSDVIELQVAYQQILTDKPLAGEFGGLRGREAQPKLYSESCSYYLSVTCCQT